MNAYTVFMNLLWLIPATVCFWYLASSPSLFPSIFGWIQLAICVVPLGCFLAASVGFAYGEPLKLAAFNWVGRPIYAAGVFASAAFIGGFFSYGIKKALDSFFASRKQEF